MAAARKNIGIRADDYRLDVRSALRCARQGAFASVELGADRGEVAPENLSESGRRHLARIISGEGLRLASLSHEAGPELSDAARTDEAVARTAEMLRLTRELGAPILAHDVGELLDLPEPRRALALDALRELGAQAERYGAVYAVRSRLARPDDLAAMVQAIASPLVRISIDPAQLLMAGFDPLEALAHFGDQVVLAYVRDATRGSPHAAGQETALGAGRLVLPQYLAMLDAAGYHAAPILRRERGLHPAKDIAADRAILEAHILG